MESEHMFVAMRNAVHCCHVLAASAKDVSRREGFRGIPRDSGNPMPATYMFDPIAFLLLC